MPVILKSKDERQEEARVKWIKSRGKGCCVWPTGTGKTICALKIIKSVVDKYPTIKFLIVVPTDNLKIQWEQNIDNFGLSFNGGVLVVNTAIKNNYKCDILVIDECHRVNSLCFRDIFTTIQYKYVLGLTATYERLDGLHKEVMAKYCPIIDTITLKEALDNKWVSPFKEYAVMLEVDDIATYKQYNRDFIKNFEFFGFDFNLVMSLCGPNGWKNKLALRDKLCPKGSEEQKKEVLRNITICSAQFMRALQSRKKFINNHLKKLEVTRKIIEARPFSKIITFSNNIKMAEAIGIGEVYTGKDSKKKARANLEEFNIQTTGILNSCMKLNEGMDVQGLNVAIILGLDSSETKAVQRRGRCIRFEEGKVAEIFNLIIADTVESKWFADSHKNSPYTIIDEAGLDAVLRGEEPKPYTRKIKDFTFRY